MVRCFPSHMGSSCLMDELVQTHEGTSAQFSLPLPASGPSSSAGEKLACFLPEPTTQRNCSPRCLLATG